ncbi:hypothetical protein [Streptomyces sp. KAU_LT]|uniref:hypothetical protein n=1 Tax=Streptomyces sp. KAU_LT TaxID=3046669 RepID=UPI0024B64D3C|nr:hypothetical protein [Streptomyces sp. KAU_LT]MDI9831350.1 hypothetical protein [Streptomyces sp. KAU_LT]
MMKKRSKAFGAAAAALLAVLAVDTPASAVTYTVTTSAAHAGDVCTVNPYYCHGSASFIKDGDHLLVWDNNSDGHSVVVRYIRSDDGKRYDAWHHYGAGKRLDVNMDLPEGKWPNAWIQYEVCLGEYNGGNKPSIMFETCSDYMIEDTQ